MMGAALMLRVEGKQERPGQAMPKTLFINSTPDIDRLWKRVHGQGDIAIAVNMGPVAEGGYPGAASGL